ncbi:MAG: hypothetical protein ABSH08_13260 [Tepidisphaeraceae bacterium]|jgi:hypothetical protein
MTTEIEIKGISFDNVDEAIQHTFASGRGVTVSVEGIDGYLVVEQEVADALAENGVGFAYFFDHEMPDGSSRVVSVPVG